MVLLDVRCMTWVNLCSTASFLLLICMDCIQPLVWVVLNGMIWCVIKGNVALVFFFLEDVRVMAWVKNTHRSEGYNGLLWCWAAVVLAVFTCILLERSELHSGCAVACWGLPVNAALRVAVLGLTAAPRWTAAVQVNGLPLLAVLWFLHQLCPASGCLAFWHLQHDLCLNRLFPPCFVLLGCSRHAV